MATRPRLAFAGRLRHRHKPIADITLSDLTELIETWEHASGPLTEEQRNTLAQFAASIGAFGRLPFEEAMTLHTKLVKALFAYGRWIGRKDFTQ